MASLPKDVNQIGLFDTWALDAGSSKVQAVGPDDTDDTSYVRTGVTNARQAFDVANITSGEIADGSTINKITITIWARRTTVGSNSLVMGVYKTTSDIAEDATPDSITNALPYVTYTHEMTTDPHTSAAWALATLRDWAAGGGAANRRSFGFKSVAVVGALRVTRMTVTIDYTAGAAAPTQPAWGVILG